MRRQTDFMFCNRGEYNMTKNMQTDDVPSWKRYLISGSLIHKLFTHGKLEKSLILWRKYDIIKLSDIRKQSLTGSSPVRSYRKIRRNLLTEKSYSTKMKTLEKQLRRKKSLRKNLAAVLLFGFYIAIIAAAFLFIYFIVSVWSPKMNTFNSTVNLSKTIERALEAD